MKARTWIVAGLIIAGAVAVPVIVALTGPKRQSPTPVSESTFDRGENGLWASRHWVHGTLDRAAQETLAGELEQWGITRFYPFLGPPNADGVPGYRSDGVHHPYVLDTARAFFANMDELAPTVEVIVWTGGVLGRDIDFGDEERLRKFVAELARITEAGADGVQINVEPLPSNTSGYLTLLRDIKAAIGDDKILSIAAYPPETPLHPFPDVHWTLEFTTAVCEAADEMAFMGYDTALRSGSAYRGLMADWTADLMSTLPRPDDGGCEWWMGVPAYEDEGVGYHDPDTETIAHAIEGVRAGLARAPVREHFRGIVLYASWTTEANEWQTYERAWRGVDSSRRDVTPDFR